MCIRDSFITDNIMGMLFVVLNILVFSVMLLVLNVKILLLFLLFSVVSVIYNLVFLRKRKYLDYSLFTAESERRNVIYEMVMEMCIRDRACACFAASRLNGFRCPEACWTSRASDSPTPT